jgi:hypothetical protein
MKKKLFLATPALLIYFAMHEMKLSRFFGINIHSVL